MKSPSLSNTTVLRRAAESRLKSEPSPRTEKTDTDLRRIQHELEVHQVELKMQNEELLAARAEIEAGLERYTDLFDFAPVGYFNLSPDGRILLANLTGAELVRSERSKLRNQKLRTLVAEADQSTFDGFLARVYATDSRQDCELMLDGHGHPSRFVQLSGTLAPNGKECRTVMLDVTERRRAQDAARQTAERFAGIVNSAMDAIISHDSSLRIVLFNAAAERMFGYKASDMIGKPLDILIPERLRPAHVQQVAEFMRAGVSARRMGALGAVSGLRSNGEEFPIEASISLIVTENDRIATVILRDVTERLGADAALRESEEQLRALATRLQIIREEERTHIAREIHDVLAQELTRLKIDLAWAGRRLAKSVDEPTRAALAEKLQGMTRQTNNAITTVQKIATELRPVVLDSLGLSAAVEWLAQDFTKHTGLTCLAKVPVAEPAVTRNQATAVFRILQESLTNVIRHARATRVHVCLAADDGRLILTVRDNGRGIASKKLRDMHSIGLTGMRERAQIFGGTVEFQGVPGKGTLVTVRMPIVAATEDSNPCQKF